MAIIVSVQVREDETGRKFPFVDFGGEDHGKSSFRLWVSAKLITSLEKDTECNRSILKAGTPVLQFPVAGATIRRSEKGSLILSHQEDSIVYDLCIKGGYRGSGAFTILSPTPTEVVNYALYASPGGNLGIDHGALVAVSPIVPLKYRWERSGRLYGNPGKGITILTPDGRELPFESVPGELNDLYEALSS